MFLKLGSMSINVFLKESTIGLVAFSLDNARIMVAIRRKVPYIANVFPEIKGFGARKLLPIALIV